MAPDPQENKSKTYLPDVGDILFICIVQVLLFGRPSFLFQDCSVGWHLLSGQYILDHRKIPSTDIVSYSFPNGPWVPYEWFFDLLASILTNIGGFNLLSVFCASLIAYVFVKTYDTARRNGASLALSTSVCIVGILASAVHWLARPHIFTFLCFSIFLSVLKNYEAGRISSKKLLVFLNLTMLLWVNSHPAFPLGIIQISIFILSAFFNRSNFEKIKFLIIALATTCATTLINPNFINLHLYILHYLKANSVLANTEEFMSPVFHGNIHALCLEILIIYLILGLFQYKRSEKIPISSLLATIFTMHMSLSAVRSIPLFVLSTVPLIGFLFGGNGNKQIVDSAHTPKSSLFSRISASFAAFDAQEKQSKKRILTMIYISTIFILAFSPFMKTGFNDETTPTANLEYIDKNLRPETVGYSGFNLDNWGGLLAYKLKMKVFIDDRADYYGEKFYTEYGTIVQTNPGWQSLLDKHKINWILMPTNSKLASILAKDSQWSQVSRDKASVIFQRRK